jgi:para-nitrobenzyl esterase
VDGAVHGQTIGTTSEFLGIPYAAPPVGPLRWQSPQPVAHWTGVRTATQFAPNCAQPASNFGLASMSENCLYLNVYAPADHKVGNGTLPVMVWFHGGVFVWGESNDYDPAQLVKNGVIVVTINYRLGALGFLAHPALASHTGGPSGDYGLMDQQAALRWVQHNIRAFGGNPHNVTLFGESSGGLSVLSQLASPGARGLFNRAIVESGAYTLTPVSLATAELAGQAFASSTGCSDQTASCLRSLPVSTILKDQDPAGYRPDIDGQVLTESLEKAFATGDFNRVPIINGSNLDERRLFIAIDELIGDPITAINYESMIESTEQLSVTQAAAVVAHYPLGSYPSPAVALSAVQTDASFACLALTVDTSTSKYVPTYSYEFADQQAPKRYEPPVSFPYGAAHESDVQYLFDLDNTPYPGVLSPQQQTLAASMRRYWTNFATDGNPSSSGAVTWPRFGSTNHHVLSLDVPSASVESNFATSHQCAFWAGIH